jgi:hypothetical protein
LPNNHITINFNISQKSKSLISYLKAIVNFKICFNLSYIFINLFKGKS